jgi:hypothetical protein
MARRGHGCRCCGCSFNNIFRCEQLSVNLWNQSGELPVLTCDSAPSPGNLQSVSAWLTSGAFASGGELAIDLDAAGLNIAAASSNGSLPTQTLRAAIIGGLAVVESFSNNNAIRLLSLNGDSRRAALNPLHGFSVRSCKVNGGRFVTAYAAGGSPVGAAPNVPSLTPRMTVQFNQQGESGFTNQPIIGLQSPMGGYLATQACRAAVYRDGEYVDTVTRDASLCVIMPDGTSSVSLPSGPALVDRDADRAEIASLEAERVTIQPPPDPNAGLRLTLAVARDQAQASINTLTTQINQLTSDLEWAANVDFQQFPWSRVDRYFVVQSYVEMSVINIGDYGDCAELVGDPVETTLFMRLLCVTDQLGQEGLLAIDVAYRTQLRADKIAERAAQQLAYDSAVAQLAAIPPAPGLSQGQLARLAQIATKIASLRAIPIVLIDYVAGQTGLVRLSGNRVGWRGADGFDYTGGINTTVSLGGGDGLGEYTATYVPGGGNLVSFESATYFHVNTGDRFRIAVRDGGSGTLSITPSGAILGTFNDATNQDGSYLVITRYDDDCLPSISPQKQFDDIDDDWLGVGGVRRVLQSGMWMDIPRRFSQRRYEFNSFVVDKTPPSIVARQVDDFVVGSEPEWLNFAAADRVQATPLLFADEPVIGDNGGTNWAFYTTRPTGPGMPPGYYRAANSVLKDRAHNFPLLTPAVEFTIHEEMSGAKATFAVPQGQSMSRTSPLQTVDLVFDKTVVGITKRNFTIEAYGSRPDGTYGEIQFDDDLSRIAPTNIVFMEFPQPNRCRITFDTTTQLRGTLWRIVFQPDEGVIAAEAAGFGSLSFVYDTAREATDGTPARLEACFWRNEDAQGNYQIISYDSTSKKWVFFGTANEFFGMPSGEPCILAARLAWIVKQPEENIRQVIDVSGFDVEIGTTSSVSTLVAEPDPAALPVTKLASSANVLLPASGGQFHSTHDADSFIPNAPPNPDGPVEQPHSYFGLTSTIYPSPARRVSACAAPRSSQKHFSLLMSENDYTTITATMSHVPMNGEWVASYIDGSGKPFEVASGPHFQFSPFWEEPPARVETPDGYLYPQPGNIFLQKPFSGPFTFSPYDTFGNLLPPNSWSGSGVASQFWAPVWGPIRGPDTFLVPSDFIGSSYWSSGSSMRAYRMTHEIPGLATAVPGDLVLAMVLTASWWATVTRDWVVRQDGKNVIVPNTYTTGSASETRYVYLHLSKAQEHQLATTGSVQVVTDGISQKWVGTPDPRPGIPLNLGDITKNRHVWTLSAS